MHQYFRHVKRSLCFSALPPLSFHPALRTVLLKIKSAPLLVVVLITSSCYHSISHLAEAIYAVSHDCTPISAHSNVSLTTRTLLRRGVLMMEFKSSHVLSLILNIGRDRLEIMTASVFSVRAVKQNLLPSVKIPASRGPVAGVWHYIASNCITLNLFEVPVALLTPLFRLGFHSFDPNKKDNRKRREATRVRDAVAMSLLRCHTQERANVTLYQAPVCASCMVVKAEVGLQSCS